MMLPVPPNTAVNTQRKRHMATLITGKAADKKASISRSLRHKLIKEGKFPQPVQIGVRRIAFVESEVESWIAARVAASRTKCNGSAA
jgi:prophage regulatory protein